MKFIENLKAQFREMRDQFRAFKGNAGAYVEYGKMLRKDFDESRRAKKWGAKKKKD